MGGRMGKLKPSSGVSNVKVRDFSRFHKPVSFFVSTAMVMSPTHIMPAPAFAGEEAEPVPVGETIEPVLDLELERESEPEGEETSEGEEEQPLGDGALFYRTRVKIRVLTRWKMAM